MTRRETFVWRRPNRNLIGASRQPLAAPLGVLLLVIVLAGVGLFVGLS